MNENIINKGRETIFLGDSITAWNSELKKYENIKNYGVPGFISRDIVWQLQGDDEEVIFGHTAVLMIGVNDILMGFSVEKIVLNINEIINMLKNRFERIILVSVLPIDNLKMNKEIREINQEIKDIEGTEFLDIHNLFLNEHDMIDYKFTTDGAHLSNYGYETFNQHLFKILNK